MKSLACFLLIASAGFGQRPWFSSSTASSGTTCTGATLDGSIIQITWTCGNFAGSNPGSFISTGNPLTESVTLGLGGVTCVIAINATAAPVTLGSFGQVAANGAAYSCGGDTVSSGQWIWAGGRASPLNDALAIQTRKSLRALIFSLHHFQ